MNLDGLEGWINEWIKQIDAWMDGYTNKQLDGYMIGQMDLWMALEINSWMN